MKSISTNRALLALGKSCNTGFYIFLGMAVGARDWRFLLCSIGCVVTGALAYWFMVRDLYERKR